MKRKSKLKKILIPVIALVLVAAIGVGIWLGVGSSGGDPVNVYPFMYLGMTEYWGDNQESYGAVTTDKIQTVYVSDTQTVTEIKVSVGDTVKKGDVLMTFDTTLSDLALERKRLEVEKLKLQLQDEQNRLYEINAMKPMVIPSPPAEGETDENLGETLTDPYRLSHNTDFDGSTAEKALICWLNSATAIDDGVLSALLQQARDFQTINASKPPEATEPAGSTVPAPAAEPPAADTPAADPTVPSAPAEVDVKGYYVVFKVTEGNQALAAKTAWQGIYVILDEATGQFRFKFFNADLVQDHMLSPDEEAEDEPEIDYGSGFTAAQIAEMRAQQEKAIRDAEFNIKMAEADYKIMQTETADGNVYATVDGTVQSLLSEDEARMMGQPLLKVSGGGGFYVQGSISELEKDAMQIGQEVTINDWNTGMTYTGTVQSLGDYPSADGYWSGMGNPTTTYYPFTVFIDESADLQAGSYVNIQYSTSTAEHGVYLENPFIRTENGRSYVYVMGADGCLEQRFVVLGKSLWGSYVEILEGITEEDLIAFPYGKNVKPGAAAVEADISELYNY